MLKLVPFNAAWIDHDKLDLHAIYRRPRFVEDMYGERTRELDANGVPTWDLSAPLPVHKHSRWVTKGFQYVTLADRESLVAAARNNTILDQNGQLTRDWRQYDQHATSGPWNYRLYAMGVSSTATREAEELRADVERFGSEAVEAIRQRSEPSFKLPAHLQGFLPGGRRVEGAAPASSDLASPASGSAGAAPEPDIARAVAAADAATRAKPKAVNLHVGSERLKGEANPT